MPAKSKKAPVANATTPKPPQPAMDIKSTNSNGVPAPSNKTTAAGSASRVVETASLMEDKSTAPHVNRKKQKRREKEAAKKAAEQPMGNGVQQATHNGQTAHPAPGRGPRKGYFNEEPDYVDPDFADEPLEADEAFYSGDEELDYPLYDDPATWQHENAHGKKRKNKRHSGADIPHRTTPHTQALPPRNAALVPRPTLSNAALRSAHKMSTEQIWNTSSQAERDNIKQFWLELGEEERRSLVKVEKEAVLRKMKEQQKHSCSCSVCGRKRTAIEEELEVLYDAYYEELEQFANNGNDLSNGHPMLSASRAYRQIRSPAQPMAGSFPSRGRVHEMGEDEEELDDEEYDDEDEPYSDEEYDEPAPDFFTFGNSLTVKDGILTVADDLLKNDGKHFIDMMEQLAERRMQREEDIYYPSTALAHQNVHQGHNHPPLDEDDDYDDDEDDEDYDSQEEDEFENDEMDSMTEEQRMEEGRRMFQIFAARMFEQRVLTAYREKVAAERQRKLLDELEQEGQLDAQREAKKAREAAKKKEKKKMQKQAKDEEKAKKDAEKAAQEAAVQKEQEKKLEEQRQKKEEQRKKREAERKATEDERQRKEADKQRRALEERERQAEAERKQRESKEREKKKREEAKQKERNEREAKEKESRELKVKQDQDRKAKEEERKEKDATMKSGHGSIKRQPIALPPGLQPPAQISNTQSPLLPIATPMVPIKAPTPGRPRQASHQGQQSSHASSPRSQHAMTETSHSSASPASVAVPQTPAFGNVPLKSQNQTPMLHHPQPSAPLSPLNQQTRNGHLPFAINGGPGLGLNGPGASAPGMMHPHMQNFGPPMSGQRFGPPQGMPYPPGFNAPRYGQGQPMPFHSQPPMPPPISAPHSLQQKPVSHSRQPSGSQQEIQPAPIGGNRPVGRPSSTTPDKQLRQVSGSKALLGDSDVDNLATHLGSKALLDDDADVPFVSSQGGAPKVNIPLGPPGSGRAPFSSSFGDGKFDMGIGAPNWGGFSPNVPNASSWGAPGPNARNGGWQQTNNAFGSIGGKHGRSNASRPFAIRNLLAQACRLLATPGDGFIPAVSVLRQVEAMKSSGDPPVTMDEMMAYCETEGNAQNGGGSFEVRSDGQRGWAVKFLNDASAGGRSVVGDIGSPILSHGLPGFGAPGRGF